MARARYYKTLFIPPLQGQYKLWKNEVAKVAGSVDEVVQLGNLIGCSPLAKDKAQRGPNLAVLNYIILWRSTYSNWTQLIGPNEIMALNHPDEWTNAESNRLLRKRWLSQDPDRFLVASVNKNRLVTHGGLTHGLWVELGRPETAEAAARLLNERFQGTLYQGEAYRLGDSPNHAADPIFADPLWELYPSWITAGEDMPFSQIHGSGGVHEERGGEFLNSPYSTATFLDAVNLSSYGSFVKLPGEEATSAFWALGLPLPQDRLTTSIERPWRLRIENIPVVDTREELFREKES